MSTWMQVNADTLRQGDLIRVEGIEQEVIAVEARHSGRTSVRSAQMRDLLFDPDDQVECWADPESDPPADESAESAWQRLVAIHRDDWLALSPELVAIHRDDWLALSPEARREIVGKFAEMCNEHSIRWCST